MDNDPLLQQDVHLIELQGVENYRDLGGYKTHDGRALRWGRLFRSGQLSRITECDHELVRPLNIRTVFDLRGASERERFPSNWYERQPPKIVCLEQEHSRPATTLDIIEEIMAGHIGREEVLAHMLEDYSRIPSDYSPLLKELVEVLAESASGAVLVHCMAGKDRTGVVIGLLLRLLDIETQAIEQDYLLSNQGFDPEGKLARMAEKYQSDTQDAEKLAQRIDAVRVMARVETSYLQAALDTVDQNFGSVRNFFVDAVGVDANTIEALAESILE